MNKIKTFFIHLLGGFTSEEQIESNYNSWTIGRYDNIIRLIKFAENLNGQPADVWCKKMYCKLIEIKMETINGNDNDKKDQDND